MTTEQMETFIGAAQMGMACGLEHPIEWLMNTQRGIWMVSPHDEIGDKQTKLIDAFIAFFKGTAGSPEEDERLQELDLMGLQEMTNAYYARGKHED